MMPLVQLCILFFYFRVLLDWGRFRAVQQESFLHEVYIISSKAQPNAASLGPAKLSQLWVSGVIERVYVRVFFLRKVSSGSQSPGRPAPLALRTDYVCLWLVRLCGDIRRDLFVWRVWYQHPGRGLFSTPFSADPPPLCVLALRRNIVYGNLQFHC